MGSTNRRISQGQAMRSIFGRARVTQTVRPCASRAGSFARRHQRQFCGFPAFKTALEHFGRYVLMPEPRPRCLRELLAALADDDGGLPRELVAPIGCVLDASA